VTVEELIRRVRVALNDRIEPFQVSNEQIFDWLNEAYLRVQLEHTQWRFFERRGLLFSLVADTEIYSIAQYKEMDYDATYIKRPGGTATWPISRMEYDHWQQDERVNHDWQGIPRYFVELPDEQLLFTPMPKEAWDVYGAAWLMPVQFTALTDEPVWEAPYHTVVLFEALQVAGMEWPEEKQAARIRANVKANLIPLKRAFYQRYLPSTRGARALV